MANAIKSLDLKAQRGFRTTAYLCLFILYAPILLLTIYSFNSGDFVNEFEGFSFRWYVKAFFNEEFHAAAINTMIITVVATVVSTIFATIAAIGTTRVKPWWGMGAAFMVLNLPLMVPEIITAVATLSFFALLSHTFHLDFGIGNLIIAHTVFCIPFAYMPIRARLEDMDLTLENAAADLYANPWNAFKRVTLPLLVPGIMSGAALAFITSFDDFTITQLVANSGQTTLPLYIWGKIKLPITPEVNAISTILLVISVSFIVISTFIAKARKSSST